MGLGLGGNVGDPFALTGNLATGATRLQSIGVGMESRGAGPHASPRLSCPEVDDLSARAAGSPSGDQAVTRAFVAAVRACAERLRAEGVDPADYGITAMAADADDLRVALGIDQFTSLGTQGTSSRVLFEYLRAFPDRAAKAHVDSPWLPDVDDLTGGVEGTRRALNELFTACDSDPDCAAAYPGLDRTWQRALDRLAVTPLHGTYGTADGREIDVLVDAPKLLRAARFALGGDGPAAAGALPATIAAAANGEATPWLLATSAEDPLFCVGYRPFCSGQQAFSLGTYLTAFCAEQEPFIDDTALAAAIDGDPVYETVFADSPYRAACTAWGVPPADPSIVEPVDTAVPLLMLPGQFDSFTTVPAAQAAASRLTSATVLEVPGQTHNTLGFAECAIAARNTWAEDPTVPPPVDACADAPPLDFVIDDSAERDDDSPPPGSTVDTTDVAAGIPDGTYEMTQTRQQAIDACAGEETAYDESIVQLVLRQRLVRGVGATRRSRRASGARHHGHLRAVRSQHRVRRIGLPGDAGALDVRRHEPCAQRHRRPVLRYSRCSSSTRGSSSTPTSDPPEHADPPTSQRRALPPRCRPMARPTIASVTCRTADGLPKRGIARSLNPLVAREVWVLLPEPTTDALENIAPGTWHLEELQCRPHGDLPRRGVSPYSQPEVQQWLTPVQEILDHSWPASTATRPSQGSSTRVNRSVEPVSSQR